MLLQKRNGINWIFSLSTNWVCYRKRLPRSKIASVSFDTWKTWQCESLWDVKVSYDDLEFEDYLTSEGVLIRSFAHAPQPCPSGRLSILMECLKCFNKNSSNRRPLACSSYRRYLSTVFFEKVYIYETGLMRICKWLTTFVAYLLLDSGIQGQPKEDMNFPLLIFFKIIITSGLSWNLWRPPTWQTAANLRRDVNHVSHDEDFTNVILHVYSDGVEKKSIHI